MAGKANSVNIKSQSDYHHGDLRAAALALGLQKLGEAESPDVGLRELARELGVSATALYRHFPNKDALLDSLALAALRRLGETQAAAGEAAGGGKAAFHEVGYTYVKWAAENPALFRMIFSRVGRVDGLMAHSADLGPAFQQLQAGVASALPDETDPGRVMAAQLRAWSIVHGLAHLIVDGQLVLNESEIRSVLKDSF